MTSSRRSVPRRQPRVARRFVVLGGGTIAFALAMIAASACSTEAETHYGNPNNLKKSNLPGEAGIEPLGAICGEAGIGDAAAPVGDACAVSWSKDLYPKVNGDWQCSSAACHQPGKQVPAIDPANAAAALTSLKAYKMSTKPNDTYIGTTGDPSKSTIECNLSGQCDPAMPLAPGKLLTDDDRCKLHAWLQCGAPSN